MIKEFERRLLQENYANNTILVYKYAVKEYFRYHKTLDKWPLLQYRSFLMDMYSPKTVNLRIRSINKYLEFCHKPELRLKSVKIPKTSFLEKVISKDEYDLLRSNLRKKEDLRWYFVVWTLAATGARISELTQIKAEHIRLGFLDIYSKGGKMRRLYFPNSLRREMLEWIGDKDGHLFLNRTGRQITPRGISLRLKQKAKLYGVNPDVVHPHSFRHLFALNFLSKSSDLVLLADLMGHESIDTTRIYLQRSSREQQKIIDELVDW